MRALLPLLFLLACGADPAAEPEPAPVEQPEPEVLDEEEEEDEELEGEPPTPRNLDEMDRGELETACFQGSQAACDRLGH